MSPAASALPITPENAGSSATVTESFLRLLSHVKVENLVAGLSGGVVSTMILHPLDLVKIRFAGKIQLTPCIWLALIAVNLLL